MAYNPDSLNDTVVNVFGVDCEVNGVSVRGIYEAPHRGITAGGYPIEIEDYSLALKTDELEPTGATEGDKVFIDTTEFRITAIKPDYAGMTVLTLAEYA